MKKAHRIIVLLFIFIMCMTGTAFASTIGPGVVSVGNNWKKDATGWWYVRGNGTYPANQWELINGVWYCFDTNGYMLSDTYVFNISDFERRMTIGMDVSEVYVYYVTSDGSMLANSYTPDGVWANEAGEILISNMVIGIGLDRCYLIE